MKACIMLLLVVTALSFTVAVPSSAVAAVDEVRITTSSTEARTKFQNAITLVYNLRFDEARGVLKSAIGRDPDFAMAHYLLSVLAPTPDAALNHITSAQSVKAKVSDGERMLIDAQHALLTGAVKKSEALTRDVVRKYPDDVWARLALGTLYLSTGRNQEAVTELESTLAIQPGCPPALNLLGYAHMALGQNEAAETAFTRYIEAIPNEPNPHDSYAEFLMKIGRFDDAIRSYEKALTLDKHFHSATVGIGNCLILQDHPAAARLRFQTLYENTGTTEWKRAALSGLIRAYVSEGKYDRAIAEAKRCRDISVKEKNAIAAATDHALISTLMLASESVDPKSGTYLKSRTAGTRTTNPVTPTITDAYKSLQNAAVPEEAKTTAKLALLGTEIEAAVQQNDLTTARRKADEHREIATSTGHPIAIKDASMFQGMIAAAEKRYADAVRDFTQSDLTNARALFRLMEAHEAMGNTNDAREVRTKILALNNGSLQLAMVKRWISQR